MVPIKVRNIIISITSVVGIIIIWHITSIFSGSILILPSPILVFTKFFGLIQTQKFWQSMFATFLRGIFGFTIAAIPGFFLGFFSGISEIFKSILKPTMTILKSTPVLAFILLALIWFGSDFVPVFTAFLMALPIIVQSTEDGFHAVDKKLLEYAHIFSLSKKRIVKSIYIPSLLPYFISGAGNALGLTWKVVIAGEVLSQPIHALGTGLQNARINIETAEVLALTIASIILCMSTDFIFSYIARRVHLEYLH